MMKTMNADQTGGKWEGFAPGPASGRAGEGEDRGVREVSYRAGVIFRLIFGGAVGR
jgi:hypothetical protein